MTGPWYSRSMPLTDCPILTNHEIADDYFQMDLAWDDSLPAPTPGQFVTVRIGSTSVPLLRRPFGISGFVRRTDGSAPTASMIYWRRGDGTRALAGLGRGETLNLMGPLGVGFPQPGNRTVPVLVAGGVGIGPILFFANSLAGSGRSPLLLLGARTASRIPRVPTESRVQILIATDDGSEGFHGTAIEMLSRTIDVTSGDLEIYLCGPHPMLRAGHELSLERGIPAWVSMEQTMGCAVGACMGCAIPIHGPGKYARVCTEGPVFRSTELVWE